MMSPMLAAKAYAAALNHAGSAGQAPKAGAADDGPGFADILKNAVSEAVTSSRHAEAQMIGQAQGKVELVDAVTAISSAQTSLETLMAVRDQVISAYQQIMQMPI
jgi:flagellar hook-basal body complex protein FliE